MLSQGWFGCEGIREYGQASPMRVPSICVLPDGQIGESVSTRTVHNVGTGIRGTDCALVDGCESK